MLDNAQCGAARCRSIWNYYTANLLDQLTEPCIHVREAEDGPKMSDRADQSWSRLHPF